MTEPKQIVLTKGGDSSSFSKVLPFSLVVFRRGNAEPGGWFAHGVDDTPVFAG